MNVLHLAAGNLTSGAGKGLVNLHKGLLDLQVSSRILTTHASEDPISGHSFLIKGRIQQQVHRAKARLLYALNRTCSGERVSMFAGGMGGYDLRRHPLVQKTDIIHLHWTNGLLSVAGIRKLGQLNKPIVWTLRDLWPFTGGCHYSFECSRYVSGCGKCPLFGGRLQFDRTHFQYKAKQAAYSALQSLHPVGISPWMAEQAQRSSFFKGRNVRMIWNAVNLLEFPFIEKHKARKLLGLDPQRQYLSIGAINLDYAYKGYKHLKAALEQLRTDKTLLDGKKLPALLIFGRGGEVLTSEFPGSKHFGVVKSSALLNRIYAASDGFLMPSTQEAFGKTIVESLSSGTPVVCFDNSGPKDMIAHRVCGYKAQTFDTADFKSGINWCLSTGSKCSDQCVQASRRFCHLKSATKYLELYKSITNL